MLAEAVPDLVYSRASSMSSHGGDDPVTPGAPVQARRSKSNKLRKQSKHKSDAGFSFIPESPPVFSHFPYTFSAPSSPTSTVQYASTIASSTPLLGTTKSPKRTTSMPSRKLTKQRPTVAPFLALPASEEGGLKRRSTLSFSLRRKKADCALPSSAPKADHPPLPPPRSAKFTIGPNDSDDEDENIHYTQPHEDPDVFMALDSPASYRAQSPTFPILPSRPPLTRRHADMSHRSLVRRHDFDELEIKRRRRWTLMTDEHITDQAFAETVLRRTPCISCDGHQYDEYAFDDLGLLRLPALDHDLVKRSTLLALLTTRDLLRTERHYLSQLHNLMQSTHATGQWPSYPPPSIMHDHLVTLIATSQRFLHTLEADPSVNGVANTFVRLEDDLARALTDWCRVVGGWFDEERRQKLSRNRRSQSSKTLSSYVPPVPLPVRAVTELAPTPQRSKSVWRKSWSSIPSLVAPTRPPPATHHSVRDLGILPVQRVTRYVLFFQDLLKHTDLGSPSRDVVEGAVGAAMRIAQCCDEVQGHKRFIRL